MVWAERDEPVRELQRMRLGGDYLQRERMICYVPPRHLRWMTGEQDGRGQVSRDRWLSVWETLPVRREVKNTAAQLSLCGWDHVSGSPTHPRTVGLMAEDAEVSRATMERFISTAKGCQMLTQERTVTYRAGMRATPVYALTVPAEKVGAPSALDGEFQALAEMSLQMADLDGWQNQSDEPPDWAIGC